MRSLIVLALCLLLLAAPAAAQHTVSGEYDILTGLWSWEAAGRKPLTDWLSIGYSLTAVCSEWSLKAGLMPSWAPVRQDYEVWAEVQRGPWSLRVTDWCNHWLGQADVPPWEDTYGLSVRVQWEW